ncbi:UNVERIFIED_CONTAM: hypothetical protein NCL1_25725 [Trichonephila clavipes]
MIILSVVVTLFFIRPGQAFPRGAPAEACESLLPRHYGTEPKDPEHSPYSFLASSNHYHYRMDGIQGSFYKPYYGYLRLEQFSVIDFFRLTVISLSIQSILTDIVRSQISKCEVLNSIKQSTKQISQEQGWSDFTRVWATSNGFKLFSTLCKLKKHKIVKLNT